MATFNKQEFWKELDATREEFVRNKHAMGGYGGVRQRVATEWLRLKEERRKALWQRIGVSASIAGLLVAMVHYWM